MLFVSFLFALRANATVSCHLLYKTHIQGGQIDAVQPSDVEILLGEGRCERLVIEHTNLIECYPPIWRPPGGESARGIQLLVMVGIDFLFILFFLHILHYCFYLGHKVGLYST